MESKQLKVHVSVSVLSGGKFVRLYLAKYFTPAKVTGGYTFIRLCKYVEKSYPNIFRENDVFLTAYSKKGVKLKSWKVKQASDLIQNL